MRLTLTPGCEADNEITQGEKQQADGLFGGRGGFHAPFIEEAPYSRHDGCQYHYEEWIE